MAKRSALDKALQIARKRRAVGGGLEDDKPALWSPAVDTTPPTPAYSGPTPSSLGNPFGEQFKRLMGYAIFGGMPDNKGGYSDSPVLGEKAFDYRPEMTPATGAHPEKLFVIQDEHGGYHQVPEGTAGATEAPPGSSLGEDRQLYSETNPVGVLGKSLYSLTGADTPGGARAATPWSTALGNTAAAFGPGHIADSLERTVNLPGEVAHGETRPDDILRNIEFLGNTMVGGGLSAKATMNGEGVGMFGGRLAKNADHAKLAQAERMASEGGDPKAIYDTTGWFQGADGKWRFEISDHNATMRPGFEQAKTYGQMIDHPELFDNYPAIANYPVQDMSPTMSGAASFMPTRKAFEFKRGHGKNPKDVTLHEGQHAVQNLEGFAQGSTLHGAAHDLLYGKSPEYRQTVDQYHALERPTGAQRLNRTARRQYETDVANYGDKITKALDVGVEQFPHGLLQDIYHRNAGEVEARNTSERMNMTPEQRQETPPWETESVPPYEQVVTRRPLYSNADDKSAAFLASLTPKNEFDFASPDPINRVVKHGYQIMYAPTSTPNEFVVGGMEALPGANRLRAVPAIMELMRQADQQGITLRMLGGDEKGVGFDKLIGAYRAAGFEPVGDVRPAIGEIPQHVEMVRYPGGQKSMRMLPADRNAAMRELASYYFIDEPFETLAPEQLAVLDDFYKQTVGQAREKDAMGFYSPSLEAAKAIPQEVGTVQQMRAMLLKAGGKEKELAAIGFDKAFPDPNARVNRADIETFLRDNRLQLGEERYYGRGWRERPGYHDQEIWDDGAKYEKFSTPGGMNYAERILTIPSERRKAIELNGAERAAILKEHGYDGVSADSWSAAREAALSDPRYQENLRQIDALHEGPQNEYGSSHWPDVVNPVAHYRSKDFDKTRSIEEFQSDWAQRGRDAGIRDSEAASRINAELTSVQERKAQVEQELSDLVSQQTGKPASFSESWVRDYLIDLERSGEGHESAPLMEIWRGLYDQGLDLRNKYEAASKGTPDGPFINNTSDWVGLLAKKALIDAARDQMERIAWTPGEVQVKRYNLGTHVDSLDIIPPTGNAPGKMAIKMQGRNTGSVSFDPTGKVIAVSNDALQQAVGQGLDALVGKDVARRILEQKAPMSMRGANLESSETSGMRQFYDKIVPARLAEVLKKQLGVKANIEPTDIGMGNAYDSPTMRGNVREYPSIELTPQMREKIVKEGLSLFNKGDPYASAVLSAISQGGQRPFYGEALGPKGKIADPAGTASRLNLRSGVAEAPQDGFFNPATSALLQEGVAPKQTIRYYEKQMGSRGGKLPPGMWEKATAGMKPDDVIARDELVQRLDSMASDTDLHRYANMDSSHYDTDNWSDEAQYKRYSTNEGAGFRNYTETAVGYPTPSNVRPHPHVVKKYEAEWNALNEQIAAAQEKVNQLRRENSTGFADASHELRQLQSEQGELHAKMAKETTALSMPRFFDDNHFSHPNLEGWYRTQDKLGEIDRKTGKHVGSGTQRTRILEEVQPQRYQKQRDRGEGVPQAQMLAWSKERDRAHADIALAQKQIEKIETDALMIGLDANNPFSIQQIINDSTHPLSAKLKADQDTVIALKQDIEMSKDRIRHLDGQIEAGKRGVASSPYTHDVNAATDFLLKNAVRDAADDDIGRMAWTHGEEQAGRYNQIIKGVKSATYAEDGQLFVDDPNRPGRLYVIGTYKPKELDALLGPSIAREVINRRGETVTLPRPMDIGGEGMKGFYGTGEEGTGGILTSRIKSLWRRIMGEEPKVQGKRVGTKEDRFSGEREGIYYPSVEMPQAMRDKVKKVGLSLYSNANDAAGQGLSAAARAALEREGQMALPIEEPGVPGKSETPLEQRKLTRGMYSVLDESLDKIPMKAGTPQQWLNAFNKAGVKPAEIHWRGLDDFFATKKQNDKIPKEDIANHLNENEVRVWDEEHTEEGVDTDYLRRNAFENLEDDFRYGGRSLEDYGYSIKRDDDGNYVLYDGNSEDVGTYRSEEAANSAGLQRAYDAEENAIHDMSDEEIWDTYGEDHSRGQATKGYISEEAPGEVNDYAERVSVLGEETVERKGSKGWPKKRGRDVHPDSYYDHSPGWRLESEYKDLANPRKSGTVAHEIQSRWHASGDKSGWKKKANEAELQAAQQAVREAEANVAGSKHRYVRLGIGAHPAFPDGQAYIPLNLDKIAADGLDVRDVIHNIQRDYRELGYAEHSVRREKSWIEKFADEEPAAVAAAKERLAASERDVVTFQNAIAEYVPYLKGEALGGDDLGVQQWLNESSQHSLRLSEANATLRAMLGGVDPGPWVSAGKSDTMGFLLKQGLYDAAVRGDDFYGVQGPERMKARWGERGPHEDYGRIDPRTGKEAGVIPMTLEKLAREHDKNARLEKLYPGNRPHIGAHYFSEPDTPSLPLDMPDSKRIAGYAGDAVRNVVLAKDASGNPVYVLRTGHDGGAYSNYVTKSKGATGYLTLKDYNQKGYPEVFNDSLLTFKTREAAERAAKDINDDLRAQVQERKDPDWARRHFEENEDIEEPFNAVRLTPEMRESITKRGFKMFANADKKQGAGLSAAGSEAERRVRRDAWGDKWYHGTERADRLLEKKGLQKKRATSGPMPYFSDSPEIASNYAVGKADTSRPDDGHVPDYFTVDPKQLGWSRSRTPITVEQSWNFLTPEQRATIAERAKKIGYENPQEASGPYTLHDYDATLSPSHYDYLLKQHRGNHLAALRDVWHDSGDLIGNEHELAKIYALAGYPHKISQSNAPWTKAEGVLPARIKMSNPLKTDNLDELRDTVIPALKQAFVRDRTRKAEYGADSWSKDARYTPREWVDQLERDVTDGNVSSYAFTSIPDKVTAVLKSLGYDGIIDQGGKAETGAHRVAIPFEPNQVRSDFAKFDPAKADSDDLLAANADDKASAGLAAFADRKLSKEDEKQISDYRAEGTFLRPTYDVAPMTVPMSAFDGKTIRASQVTVDPKGVAFWKKKIKEGARPSVLIEATDNGYRIVDGHTRATAYSQSGIDEIPVLLRQDAGEPVVDHVGDDGAPNRVKQVGAGKHEDLEIGLNDDLPDYVEPAAKKAIEKTRGKRKWFN